MDNLAVAFSAQRGKMESNYHIFVKNTRSSTMQDSKKFYESKTFWFNILAVVVALAGLFGFADFKPDENTLEFIALLLGGVNLILRMYTSKPISAG